MESCRVFVSHPACQEGLTLPLNLRLVAIFSGQTKQLVVDRDTDIVCNIFNASNSLPLNVIGFPTVLTLFTQKNSYEVVTGSTVSASAGKVVFSAAKLKEIERGVYKYNLTVCGQVVAEGSCVIR